MAQEGVEPSASLVLGESGLPVAYRAVIHPSTRGGIRTRKHPVLSRAARPVGVPGRLPVAEAVGLEPTSGVTRRPFSRRGPHPAGWLPSGREFRGLESN